MKMSVRDFLESHTGVLLFLLLTYPLMAKALPQQRPVVIAEPFAEGSVIDCRRPTLAYFPDPDDCRNFYHCSDWTGLQKKSCGNLYFNPVTGVCDWPSIVKRIRPECDFDEQSVPPVTHIPKAFQSFTEQEVEALKIIQINNPIRFPEPVASTSRPVLPQNVNSAQRPSNGIGQPLAPVIDTQFPPLTSARLPPPPPPFKTIPQGARQPLPPPPPPVVPSPVLTSEEVPVPEQVRHQPTRVNAVDLSQVDFVAQAPAEEGSEPAPPVPPVQRQPVVRPVLPTQRPAEPIRVVTQQVPTQRPQPIRLIPQTPVHQQPREEEDLPTPTRPTTIRVVASAPREPEIVEEEVESFEPSPPAPPSGTFIKLVASAPREPEIFEEDAEASEPRPPAPPRGNFILPPSPPPITTEPPPPPPTFETPENPTEQPSTSIPETTTLKPRRITPKKPTTPEPDEKSRTKSQVKIIRKQPSRARVRVEQKETEDAKDVERDPIVVPTRHRLPISSRPQPQEDPSSTSEPEVPEPASTTKKPTSRGRVNSLRPLFNRQRRPTGLLQRRPVSNDETPEDQPEKEEKKPIVSPVRSRFRGLRPVVPRARPSPRTTTTEKPEPEEAFLVCSGDTCFDPTIIEEEEEGDLKTAASARLPDNKLFHIFEQMTQQQNVESSAEAENIRSLLEAAKVSPDESNEEVVEEVEAPVETPEEVPVSDEDKEEVRSSPPSLFKPAAARPRLVLAARDPPTTTSTTEAPVTQKVFTLEESFTTEESRNNRNALPAEVTEAPVREEMQVTTEETETLQTTTEELSTMENVESPLEKTMELMASGDEMVEDVTTSISVTERMVETEPQVTTMEDETVTPVAVSQMNEDTTVTIHVETEEDQSVESVETELPKNTHPPEGEDVAEVQEVEDEPVAIVEEPETREEKDEVVTEKVFIIEPALVIPPSKIDEYATYLPQVVEEPLEEEEKGTTIQGTTIQAIYEPKEEEVHDQVAEDTTTTLESLEVHETVDQVEEDETLIAAPTTSMPEESLPPVSGEEELETEDTMTSPTEAPVISPGLEALFSTQLSSDPVDMILNIMQNVDLTALVSIANDPVKVGHTGEKEEESEEMVLDVVTPVAWVDASQGMNHRIGDSDAPESDASDELEVLDEVVEPVVDHAPASIEEPAEDMESSGQTQMEVNLEGEALETPAESEEEPATTVPMVDIAERVENRELVEEMTTKAAEQMMAHEEEKMTTMAQMEDHTTEESNVMVITGETVPTTEYETTISSTSDEEEEEEVRSGGGRKVSLDGSRFTPVQAKPDEEESEETDRFKLAGQRNRIRQRLRSQFSVGFSGNSASKALEILNNRANADQKEEKTFGRPSTEAPKIKKDRMRLNVTKLVDRRNELFRKRVPITTRHEEIIGAARPSPVEPSGIVRLKSIGASQPQRPAGGTRPLFSNPASHRLRVTPATPVTRSPEVTSSTENPELSTQRQKSLRCRLLRQSCTEDEN